MTVIKCACKQEECKVQIKLETDGNIIMLWYTDKDGKETLMYLDANTAIELIRALKQCILELT
ncbi:MAG: hypothetical protein DRJ18_01450 [Candidatus Methanomethylicota archaeon]|nr:MAG: hypothetical protein DRJ18_01450 [Candidatus Verstraetearchaeota archaeon]